MSGQSKISQVVLTAFAALLMSSITVAAAVGPAHAVSNPASVTLNA